MTPMVVIVCLAGLSSLPTDPMEAARVDGATPIQTFFQVNLRWSGLGFGTLYEGYDEEPQSMKWVNQYSNANMVKTDFFEAKSTAYAKSAAIVDDL